MATNLILNPDFNSGLNSWSTYGWHPGNTITALSSGGQSGACVKLIVPSEGDPGQSWIEQSVQLESGKEYLLSFYAKRMGDVDVWIQITMAGETEYSPSYIYWLPSAGSYKSVKYLFTATGMAGQNISADIRLIAGSAGGTVWFDTVSLIKVNNGENVGDGGNDDADGALTDGVIRGTNVNVRETPSTSARVITRVNTGDKVSYYANDIRQGNGYSWYPCISTKWSGIGYIATDYVEEDLGDSGSSSGSTSNGLQAGHYVVVSDDYDSVNIRPSASQDDPRMGVLLTGTKAYCSGVVNDEWVEIIWGGRQASVGYAMAKFLVDGGVADTSKAERAIKIAKSMKDKGYPYRGEKDKLGLTADEWCVQYCIWLMKAAGCSNYPDFSEHGDVSSAINYFKAHGNYGMRDVKVPAPGDWVFYKKTGATTSDPDAYYAHAGFVVDVRGDIVETVEGNLSNTIKSPEPEDDNMSPESEGYNYKTATNIGRNGYSVLGFATPTWI